MLRGFTPQAALDAPRFCIASRNVETYALDSIASSSPSEVHVEEGVPEETCEKLRGNSHTNPRLASPLTRLCIAMGHDIRTAKSFGRGMLGRGQIIQKLTDPSGRLIWAAGSDQRGDGQAVAQI